MTVSTDQRKTGVIDGVRVLAQAAVAVPLTGTVNDTTLATITIPGGSMGANGSIRITSLWSTTSSANVKTLRVKFGGTPYLNFNVTTSAAVHHVQTVSNRNSAASQIGNSNNTTPFGPTSVAAGTSTVNTNLDVVVLFTAQLASAGETITLERYIVEVMPG